MRWLARTLKAHQEPCEHRLGRVAQMADNNILAKGGHGDGVINSCTPPRDVL